MNAKQVKRLRQELRKQNKFEISVKNGYKPDYRIMKKVEKTVHFKSGNKPGQSTEVRQHLAGQVGITDIKKVERIVIVNNAKYPYQQAKKALKKILKNEKPVV
jgi:hypothetical protein